MPRSRAAAPYAKCANYFVYPSFEYTAINDHLCQKPYHDRIATYALFHRKREFTQFLGRAGVVEQPAIVGLYYLNSKQVKVLGNPQVRAGRGT